MELAQAMLIVVGGYVCVGVVFAVAFITVGLARLDPVAAYAKWAFRLLILPGAAALWPVLLLKWMRTPRARGQMP